MMSIEVLYVDDLVFTLVSMCSEISTCNGSFV